MVASPLILAIVAARQTVLTWPEAGAKRPSTPTGCSTAPAPQPRSVGLEVMMHRKDIVYLKGKETGRGVRNHRRCVQDVERILATQGSSRPAR